MTRLHYMSRRDLRRVEDVALWGYDKPGWYVYDETWTHAIRVSLPWAHIMFIVSGVALGTLLFLAALLIGCLVVAGSPVDTGFRMPGE